MVGCFLASIQQLSTLNRENHWHSFACEFNQVDGSKIIHKNFHAIFVFVSSFFFFLFLVFALLWFCGRSRLIKLENLCRRNLKLCCNYDCCLCLVYFSLSLSLPSSIFVVCLLCLVTFMLCTLCRIYGYWAVQNVLFCVIRIDACDATIELLDWLTFTISLVKCTFYEIYFEWMRKKNGEIFFDGK